MWWRKENASISNYRGRNRRIRHCHYTVFQDSFQKKTFSDIWLPWQPIKHMNILLQLDLFYHIKEIDIILESTPHYMVNLFAESLYLSVCVLSLFPHENHTFWCFLDKIWRVFFAITQKRKMLRFWYFPKNWLVS